MRVGVKSGMEESIWAPTRLDIPARGTRWLFLVLSMIPMREFGYMVS